MRFIVVAVVALLAASSVAEAQQQPRPRRAQQGYVVAAPSGTVVTTRDETGRTRTRIIVQKRSYLDGGTEVMPGDNVNSHRSSFMSHRPSAITANTAFDRQDWWNEPFFLSGKNNPYPWSGN
jgi:hypothetical protein